jgi:glycosyltransferase involved in cell wall biosynthesis
MSAGLYSTQSDPVNPWLSILIPVYNVAPYVSDCLQSILQQVDSGVEIIALDDCSTDQSLALLQEIAANGPHPIQVLENPVNLGLSATRNRLLDAARGDYIWFIDSDDLLAANAINALAQTIHTHRPDLVLCDFSVLRTEKRFKHQFRDETHIRTFPETAQVLMSDPIKLFEGIFQKRKLHIWSKISRRSLWGTDLRFPEGRLMEDIVVTPRLCLRVKTYLHVNKPWVIYRQREGSILATPSQKKLMIWLFRAMASWICG